MANKRSKLGARTGERIYTSRSSEILPLLYRFHTQWGAYASIHVPLPCLAACLATYSAYFRPRGVRLSEAQAASLSVPVAIVKMVFKYRFDRHSFLPDKMEGCVAHLATCPPASSLLLFFFFHLTCAGHYRGIILFCPNAPLKMLHRAGKRRNLISEIFPPGQWKAETVSSKRGEAVCNLGKKSSGTYREREEETYRRRSGPCCCSGRQGCSPCRSCWIENS